MRIGIIGAGPSGSYLAYRLAQYGFEVLLLDKFESREKPCGGGVTYKALSAFPLITASPIPRTLITELRIIDRDGAGFTLPLDRPFSVFSRRLMDQYIRVSAESVGARFIHAHVADLSSTETGWIIKTSDGQHAVDFLVGADGAKSLVRSKLLGPFSQRDLATTAGYYVPGNYHTHVAICRFIGDGFRGYLWSFPRHDHLSVGIISDLATAKSALLHEHVRAFIHRHYPKAKLTREIFYSAVAPDVHHETWKTMPFCGDRWALVGDAAGFADPVTGEGIYYALRSAELLAQALQVADLKLYDDRCRNEFINDFIRAGRWKAGFRDYYSLMARAVMGSRHSPALQALENEFIAGTLSYNTMRAALLKKAPKILTQVILDKMRSRPRTLRLSPLE
ncbi:MAG: NAD(P)/FAD-dependent oxidoreductase [Acidobacteria bacterium]|nr:NAD(P)/FAD-dependent oxidoreductase [Acidobacteriota bacterium]MBI3656396.1 NAD(P)/FAD-dependent oxidoreductase [Acidobacteriota bacterium]